MPWYRSSVVPEVPALDELNELLAKRFMTIKLTDLITDHWEYIEQFMKKHGIVSVYDAIKFVIEEIDYPLTRGIPDDKHVWNAFSGKACFKLTFDYWQTAFETLMTYILNKKLKGKKGYGDCEDTSILLTAFLRILEENAWVVVGKVYKRGQYLGGHAWVIAEFHGAWRLVETTLDKMPSYPSGFPPVDPNKNIYVVGDLMYKAIFRFNDKFYEFWAEPSRGDNPRLNPRIVVEKYFKLKAREKEKYSKHKAIAEAWGIPTKPLKRASRLQRFLWRIRLG